MGRLPKAERGLLRRIRNSSDPDASIALAELYLAEGNLRGAYHWYMSVVYQLPKEDPRRARAEARYLNIYDQMRTLDAEYFELKQQAYARAAKALLKPAPS